MDVIDGYILSMGLKDVISCEVSDGVCHVNVDGCPPVAIRLKDTPRAIILLFFVELCMGLKFLDGISLMGALSYHPDCENPGAVVILKTIKERIMRGGTFNI